MIIRWVQNLEEAAKARAKAQRELDGDDLPAGERNRLEGEISKRNREIERFALRINADLKKAVEKRARVENLPAFQAIADSQLQDYCKSVALTIEKLNRELATDTARTASYSRSLGDQRKQAERLKAASARTIATLREEDKKLERREMELRKTLDQRQQERKRIEAEIKRVTEDRKKIETERTRVASMQTRKREELAGIEKEKRSLEAARKNEKDFDRRQAIKAKIARLDARIEPLRRYVDESLAFQLEQFGHIEEKVRFEIAELKKAVETVKKEIAAYRGDLEKIAKSRNVIAENLEKEEKRQGVIEASMHELARAQTQLAKASAATF